MSRAAHPDQTSLMLHGVMKFVIEAIDLDEQVGTLADQAIIEQPLFQRLREILEDIPRLESEEDFKNFAQRRENLKGLWVSSMKSMDGALKGNFPVTYLVDQFMHNPKEMKAQFMAMTEGQISQEDLAPMLNMFQLLASNAIGHDERSNWQETSGNPFGSARRQGAKAEVSTRAKKAVNKRIENDPTSPAKRMVESLWREALETPGSYKGFKSEFARQMHELVKREHGGITVTVRTITTWADDWGGRLKRIKQATS